MNASQKLKVWQIGINMTSCLLFVSTYCYFKIFTSRQNIMYMGNIIGSITGLSFIMIGLTEIILLGKYSDVMLSKWQTWGIKLSSSCCLLAPVCVISLTGIGFKIIDRLSSRYLAISMTINGVILLGFTIATILLLLPMHRSNQSLKNN